MKKLLTLLFVCGGAAFAQVYATNVTAAGTGYTTAPTVTASGGGCSAEPTFAATVASGGVNAVAPTFLGTGCTGAPTLAFGGPGTGAAATALLIPASVVVLASVPSCAESSIQPCLGGQYLAWQFECWLAVPKARVGFYAAAMPFRMPGTAQTSQASATLVPGFASIAPLINADLTAGVLAAFDDYVILNSAASAATVETVVAANCTTAQTNLNAWNPWAAYGTYLNGATWTVQGVQ